MTFRAARIAAFTAVAILASSAVAQAQQKFTAVLQGHAVLPAMTLVPPPADAPAEMKISGRYAATPGKRVDMPNSVAVNSALSDRAAPRPTGGKLPFTGQPVQGFSGIKRAGNGSYLVVTDNGFGSKANSPDAMLMFHRLKPDWKTGKVERQGTIFLHDPDRKVPFLIVNENTTRRYLTGADFDLESIQPIGNDIWLGDEFGPWLIRANKDGKVLAVYETRLDGKALRSPDHAAIGMPAAPGAVKFEVRRSKGFEGMAASPDGKLLYPLLEGPLWSEATNGWEMKDGRQFLRILEFDVAKGEYTGRSFKYLLEANGNSIGDFNMIDASSGLIIERDDSEGDAAQACNGPAKPDCFNVPAKLKRIYKIDFAQADADGFVKKVGYIDLMDIADPDKKARQGGRDGRLTFPFFTIENVEIVDADHIIVGNDNNLPFSSGRALGKLDDNEFVLLKVTDFLKAK